LWLPSCGGAKYLEYKLGWQRARQSLAVFLQEIEQKSNARFFFLAEWLEPISFQKSYEGTLGETLEQVFLGSGLSYVVMHPDEVVILKDPHRQFFEKSDR